MLRKLTKGINLSIARIKFIGRYQTSHSLKKMGKSLISRSHAPAWECIPYGVTTLEHGNQARSDIKKV